MTALEDAYGHLRDASQAMRQAFLDAGCRREAHLLEESMEDVDFAYRQALMWRHER